MRAAKLYNYLINGHKWEIRSTEVITADQPLYFKGGSLEHVTLLSAPIRTNTQQNSDDIPNVFVVLKHGSTFKPIVNGYYDYCYAKITGLGEYEIDQSYPAGRFIVLPAGARKEIIHELPAFDESGPVLFEDLIPKLEILSNSGVTAVHVTGAIERNDLHNLLQQFMLLVQLNVMIFIT